jgi:hypothetical protein
MKNIYLITLFLGLSTGIAGQSVSPDVLTSSGGYDESPNASLSWSLGEPSTETFNAGGIILTQGFQQPIIISITGIDLEMFAFLEGPFNGMNMNTSLTGLSDFPLLQPYSLSPWNYPGTEQVITIPAGVVDWILVELRDAPSAVSATAATVIARQAAFLMNDGSIKNLDGTGNQQFDNLTIQHSLFAVIYHRNHLAVMSANPLTEIGGVYSYDFTSPSGQAYNDGQKEITAGIWGMYAGDANASGLIDITDKDIVWESQSGRKGYMGGDMDMNTQTDNRDKNDFWIPNIGTESQVPE